MSDTDTQRNTSQSAQGKWLFALILGIPVVVIGLSTVLYFLADDRMLELGTVNRGELIDPPRELAALAMRDEDGGIADLFRKRESNWRYVVVASEGCDLQCEKMVYLTRQTHVALGKKSPRVERSLLLDESAPAPDRSLLEKYPELSVLRINNNAFRQLMGDARLQGVPGFYVVDPMGWLMMRYHVDDLEQATLNQLGKDVLKDMRRLLR